MQHSLTPFYLVIGQSGSGKDTIVDLLCRDDPSLKLISYTTREPRFPGEKTHKFISEHEFNMMCLTKKLLAYTEFDNKRYAALVEDAESALYYIIDPAGVVTLGESELHEIRDVHVVYITANEDVRAERMKQRGDDEETVKRRIQYDRRAFDPALFSFLEETEYKLDTSDDCCPEESAERLRRMLNL